MNITHTQLTLEIYRCAGTDCPSAKYCARFTDQPKGSNDIVFAAFWARRAPDEISCDCMIPNFAVVLPVGETV